MNLIQRQAEDFLEFKFSPADDYKGFINDLRIELYEYKRDSYKVEFLECVIHKVKKKSDKHLETCKKGPSCSTNLFYENVLFFLQQELEELEGRLDEIDFSSSEKKTLSKTLELILVDLNQLKHGQEITYTDLNNAVEELKDYYFLNKRNWIQLLAGKLTEMVAGGLIEETVSKDILQIVKDKYPHIFS